MTIPKSGRNLNSHPSNSGNFAQLPHGIVFVDGLYISPNKKIIRREKETKSAEHLKYNPVYKWL